MEHVTPFPGDFTTGSRSPLHPRAAEATGAAVGFAATAARRGGSPLVLLGDTRSKSLLAEIRSLGWGRCVVRDRPDPFPGERWMLDCGSWRVYKEATSAGIPPYKIAYDWSRFRSQLDAEWGLQRRLRGADILVVPDRVGDGLASLVESMEWLHGYWTELRSRADDEESSYDDRLRAFISEEHTPWFIGVQPGITPEHLDWECSHCGQEIHRHFSGILLGGTAAWKGRTAAAWAEFATEHQMLLHYPRAGTAAKYDHAVEVGADSVDSALPLWTLQRFARYREHVVACPTQGWLFDTTPPAQSGSERGHSSAPPRDLPADV